jgi:hypothetical protein
VRDLSEYPAEQLGDPAVIEAKRQEIRARVRATYIRQHAPTILAGLIGGPGYATELAKLRARAITEAGLLFDETEPK